MLRHPCYKPLLKLLAFKHHSHLIKKEHKIKFEVLFIGKILLDTYKLYINCLKKHNTIVSFWKRKLLKWIDTRQKTWEKSSNVCTAFKKCARTRHLFSQYWDFEPTWKHKIVNENIFTFFPPVFLLSFYISNLSKFSLQDLTTSIVFQGLKFTVLTEHHISHCNKSS